LANITVAALAITLSYELSSHKAHMNIHVTQPGSEINSDGNRTKLK